MPQIKLDAGLLEAALVGLQLKREEIDRRIAELQRRIGGRPLVSEMTTEEVAGVPHRRNLSAAARRRIAEAQMRRWAAFRKAKSATQSKAAAPSRAARQSPAGSGSNPAATKEVRRAARKSGRRRATKNVGIAAAPAAETSQAS